ncbi:MAG: hypothetical protein HYZ58_09460 [Acidobacteria bacterium]|nr:hypothetical protein [Acidobacteriota bacterium]
MRLDLLHLSRSIRRSPASAAAAVLTLALTVGAGASIFAVVDAVLLTPPPFTSPEALVTVGETPIDQPTAAPWAVGYATFEAWRERAGSLAALEAFDGTNLTLTGLGAAERVSANDVTPGFLPLLGVIPALGRTFDLDDLGQPVAIVSNAADNDGKGFESFWVKDPDGWPLQISNGNGLAKSRKATPPAARLSMPAPFESPRWKTVWLDHLSFGVTNYKESASFYSNLLGWRPTYDEGSQNELMIGEIGDVIIRGGNPLDPNFGRGGGRRGAAASTTRSARIDHISFGISPWDADLVKAELEKRGLRAQIDTSSRHLGPDGTYVPDDIHTAAFKSYHTATPNGFNCRSVMSPTTTGWRCRMR